MILLFDIGNTNVVIGLSEKNKICKTYRLETNVNLTEDEYFGKLKSIGIDQIIFDGVAISSVVPQLDHVFVTMIKKYFNLIPLVITNGIKSGLKIRIDNQKQLGADLLCDSVGAYEKYPAPVIIIDLGTATKIMVVNKEKEYIGGAISPGIIGSLNSLVASAAKLSNISLNIPPKVIETDTTRCMQSGTIIGHACMIDGMIDRMKEEIKEEASVILTGGLAPLIKPILKTKVIHDENVLLEGLLSIYQKNIK